MNADLDNAKAALAAVLGSPKWSSMGGLSEDTIYGELAIDVATAAVAAEREACARIADEVSAWCRSFSSEETAERIAAAIRARKTD